MTRACPEPRDGRRRSDAKGARRAPLTAPWREERLMTWIDQEQACGGGGGGAAVRPGGADDLRRGQARQAGRAGGRGGAGGQRRQARGRAGAAQHPERRGEEGGLEAAVRRQEPRRLAQLQEEGRPPRLAGEGRHARLRRPAQRRRPLHQRPVRLVRAAARLQHLPRRQQRHHVPRHRQGRRRLGDRPGVPARGQHRRRRPDPLRLAVRPLPAADRPQDRQDRWTPPSRSASGTTSAC